MTDRRDIEASGDHEVDYSDRAFEQWRHDLAQRAFWNRVVHLGACPLCGGAYLAADGYEPHDPKCPALV